MREADWEARRVRMEQERERGLAFSQVLREKFQAMPPTIEELSGQKKNRGEDEEQGRR